MIMGSISSRITDLLKAMVLMCILNYDHWTWSIIVDNWGKYLCCKKPKPHKSDRNLHKYFSASLTIEIIYTVLNAVTQQLEHPELCNIN